MEQNHIKIGKADTLGQSSALKIKKKTFAGRQKQGLMCTLLYNDYIRWLWLPRYPVFKTGMVYIVLAANHYLDGGRYKQANDIF